MELDLPWPGTRVCLRRLAAADLEDFQAYRTDTDLAVYQGWEVQEDSTALDFLSRMATADAFQPEEWLQLGIGLIDDDTLIGDIGVCLSTDGREAEIGYTLNARYHHQGLASEAVALVLHHLFRVTDIDLIKGITDARNTPSVNLLERFGFEKTETLETSPDVSEFVFVLRRGQI